MSGRVELPGEACQWAPLAGPQGPDGGALGSLRADSQSLSGEENGEMQTDADTQDEQLVHGVFKIMYRVGTTAMNKGFWWPQRKLHLWWTIDTNVVTLLLEMSRIAHMRTFLVS